MKQMKKLFLFLVAIITFIAMTTTVRAKEYKYHVQMIVRNVDGSGNEYTSVLYDNTEVAYGTDFNTSAYVAENYDKYQFKGWHVSGKDRDELVGTVTITEDTVFVASYRMPGTVVSYTATYTDADTGEQIAEPDVFFGSVGDKPVVGYKYIDGYTPVNARNITTSEGLKADSSQNVFPFTYRKITQQQQQEQQQEQQQQQQQQGGNQQGGNANQPANPDNQGGNANPPVVNPDNTNPDNQNNDNPAVNPDNQGENNGETIDENETPQGQPEEIIDIDENETPQGTPDPNANPIDHKTGISSLIEMLSKNGFAFGSGFFLVLLLILFLLRRRKNNNNG